MKRVELTPLFLLDFKDTSGEELGQVFKEAFNAMIENDSQKIQSEFINIASSSYMPKIIHCAMMGIEGREEKSIRDNVKYAMNEGYDSIQLLTSIFEMITNKPHSTTEEESDEGKKKETTPQSNGLSSKG